MASKREKTNLKGFGNFYKDIPFLDWGGDTKYISHAGTAEMIRQDIKRMFPDYKFWVRSESYSGGDSIRIYVWNIPDGDYRKIEALKGRYKEGNFNGMEDIYENRKMEAVTDEGGKPVHYGVKYVFTENKPPYDAKENDMPVPDYSKPSSSSSSSSRASSGSRSRFRGRSSGGSSKPNPIRDNPDFEKVAELSTGWEVYYSHSDTNDKIALVFNYAKGKAVYDAGKWKSIKEEFMDRKFKWPMIWSLGDKCFYLFTEISDGNVSLSVDEEKAKEFITMDTLKMIDKVFIDFGYEPTGEIFINEHVTPWGKAQDDEKSELKEQIDALKILLNLEDDVNEQMELTEAIQTLELLYKTL